VFYEVKGYRENYGDMSVWRNVPVNTVSYGFIVFPVTISYSMVFVRGRQIDKKTPTLSVGARENLREKRGFSCYS